MTGFILGTKGATEQMIEDGVRMPVTSIFTKPCHLIAIKKYDGRKGISVLLSMQDSKRIKKPQLGTLKRAGITTPLRFLKEIQVEGGFEEIEKDGKKGLKIGDVELFIGSEVTPSMLFKKEDVVMVTGTSKGKGFAGVVKRHGFAGGPRTHGQSDRERAPGSIGSSTTPGRVFKGKRMAGRMGQDTVTIKGLKVIASEDDRLLIAGLVPGAQQGLLVIKTY